MAVFTNYELLCEQAYWIAFSSCKFLSMCEGKVLNCHIDIFITESSSFIYGNIISVETEKELKWLKKIKENLLIISQYFSS